MPTQTDTMEKIVALCRRRGFIFGSSEIYGGIGGFWDYGPLGCELKRNIKDAWWNDMVRNPPKGPNGREYQMVGVDCSIIMNPKVWEASGHVGGFSDPMVDCKGCKARYRADKVIGIELFAPDAFPELTLTYPGPARTALAAAAIAAGPIVEISIETDSVTEAVAMSQDAVRAFAKKQNNVALKGFENLTTNIPSSGNVVFPARDAHGKNWVVRAVSGKARSCPNCGAELTEPRAFNLMFQTYVGALQDSSSVAYLRPETAQGIFANFKNVMDSTRVKLPFGIAQMGKAFRNEINPRNYTFRSREFEQMEIEFFCHPNDSMVWFEFWRSVRLNWYESLNIKSEKLRPRSQDEKELAHYSRACTDIEYMFPFSDEPQELEGVAHRGAYDLTQHQTHSGKDMTYFDDEAWEKDKDKFANDKEAATKAKAGMPYRFIPHVIEPSAGVDRFALATITEAYSYDESRASPEFMKFHPRLAPIKAGVFPLVAKDGMPEIAEPIYDAIRKHMPCQFDIKAAIGKRYARMDEAGTPFCFTVDGQTKEDGTVTVRNRDDASQVRIDKSRCLEFLRDKLGL